MDWGPGASPVLYKDRLYIVNDNEEQSYLQAIDKNTGKEIWRVDRDEKTNWSTPYVWENPERTEIITPGTGKTRSYDLDGNLLWWFTGHVGHHHRHALCRQRIAVCQFRFHHGQKTAALRDPAGRIRRYFAQRRSNRQLVYRLVQSHRAPYNPSTLLYDGRLYVLYDNGRLSAFNPQTGDLLYEREKLPASANFTSSPWALTAACAA